MGVRCTNRWHLPEVEIKFHMVGWALSVSLLHVCSTPFGGSNISNSVTMVRHHTGSWGYSWDYGQSYEPCAQSPQWLATTLRAKAKILPTAQQGPISSPLLSSPTWTTIRVSSPLSNPGPLKLRFPLSGMFLSKSPHGSLSHLLPVFVQMSFFRWGFFWTSYLKLHPYPTPTPSSWFFLTSLFST